LGGTDKWTQETRCASNKRSGDVPVSNEGLRAVKIGQHAFQKIGALDEPAFQGLPLVRADHQWHVAQRPGAFHAAIITIDAVGNAVIAQIAVGGLPSCAFLGVRLVVPEINRVAPGWANRAGFIDAFVKSLRQRRVAI
jgi:hypothetical protein